MTKEFDIEEGKPQNTYKSRIIHSTLKTSNERRGVWGNDLFTTWGK